MTGITIPEGAAKSIKRGTEKLWQDCGLPTAFQRCEYIRATGTQYIDSGVYCTPEIVAEFRVRWNTTNNQSMGAMRNDTCRFHCTIFNKNLNMNIQYAAGVVTDVPVDNAAHYYYMSKNKAALDNDVRTFSNRTNLPSEFTFGILRRNSAEYIAYCNADFFGGKISNETEQRDFIPCYLITAWNNIPAGTIGLYDLFGSLSSNGTPFYTNEGTGAFTKGPDVT